jgi:hypothetical protein
MTYTLNVMKINPTIHAISKQERYKGHKDEHINVILYVSLFLLVTMLKTAS